MEGREEQERSVEISPDAQQHCFHAAPTQNVLYIDRVSRNVLSPVLN